MNPELVYYLWATLLLLVNLTAWASTLLTLPGNWVILAATAVFAFFYPADSFPADDGHGLTWALVAVIAGLAVLGEVIEFAAGAAGAAKQGASRRAVLLALVGTVFGSLLGAVFGSFIPIPLIGTMIGAIGGGAGGAFVGAYLGEWWMGKTSEERLTVSTAAMVGRLLGTFGKLAIGAVMLVIVTVDSFL